MFQAAKIIAVLAWPAGILLLFSREWQRRRSRGETVVSHVPLRLQVEPLPLDPEQLEIRKAKLELLRDDTQELSDGNNEKGS